MLILSKESVILTDYTEVLDMACFDTLSLSGVYEHSTILEAGCNGKLVFFPENDKIWKHIKKRHGIK